MPLAHLFGKIFMKSAVFRRFYKGDTVIMRSFYNLLWFNIKICQIAWLSLNANLKYSFLSNKWIQNVIFLSNKKSWFPSGNLFRRHHWLHLSSCPWFLTSAQASTPRPVSSWTWREIDHTYNLRVGPECSNVVQFPSHDWFKK